MAWDVVSGISIGAVNAAAISTFEIGDEYAMSDYLVELWSNFDEHTITNSWSKGLLYGLFKEGAAFNKDNFLNLITSILEDKPLKRKMVVSAVDIESGNYFAFDETTP